jgi:hypothetical protein
MGSVYARGNVLWVAYKEVGGKRVCRSTPFKVGQEVQARAWLVEAERAVDAGESPKLGPMTVGQWADRWFAKRTGPSFKSQECMTRKHGLPALAAMHIADVRPRHMVDLIERLKRETDLAPRSIRHVYATLHTMFRDAVVAEHQTSLRNA